MNRESETTGIINSDLLTIKQARAYMKCSTAFIYERRKAGVIQAIKAGKKVLLPKASIDAFLQKATNKIPIVTAPLIPPLSERKRVLTLDEACIYTGLSKSYMYKLTMAGKISFSKPLGKKIYFDINKLDAFLMSNTKEVL